MLRRSFLIGAPALLAACGTKPAVYADEASVRRAFVANSGPPRLELFTSFNAQSGNGAHSALLIHADQSVVFDPAGTFAHSTLPERHDVIYGMRRAARRAFVDYHTRSTFWTTLQTFEVPMVTAAHALRAAEAAGPVPDSMCTTSIVRILTSAPDMPFQLTRTWFPDRLHDQLLNKPGVTRVEFRQDDDADKEKYWETATL